MNVPNSNMNRVEMQRPPLLFTFGIPIMVITSYFFLAFQHDLRTSIPALVGSTAIVTISLAIVIYAGERKSIAWSPLLIICCCSSHSYSFSPPSAGAF